MGPVAVASGWFFCFGRMEARMSYCLHAGSRAGALGLLVILIGATSAATRAQSSRMTAPGQSAALRRAVDAWIVRERDAYRRGDVTAFQPCPDTEAVVLRDAAGEAHLCADVQAHMRGRMGGELAIRVDSLRALGDTGVVYNTVTFQRRVRWADRWERREIIAVHRDLWRRVTGRWLHVEMTELAPQQIIIDGRPQPPVVRIRYLRLRQCDPVVRFRHCKPRTFPHTWFAQTVCAGQRITMKGMSTHETPSSVAIAMTEVVQPSRRERIQPDVPKLARRRRMPSRNSIERGPICPVILELSRLRIWSSAITDAANVFPSVTIRKQDDDASASAAAGPTAR